MEILAANMGNTRPMYHILKTRKKEGSVSISLHFVLILHNKKIKKTVIATYKQQQ